MLQSDIEWNQFLKIDLLKETSRFRLSISSNGTKDLELFCKHSLDKSNECLDDSFFQTASHLDLGNQPGREICGMVNCSSALFDWSIRQLNICSIICLNDVFESLQYLQNLIITECNTFVFQIMWNPANNVHIVCEIQRYNIICDVSAHFTNLYSHWKIRIKNRARYTYQIFKSNLIERLKIWQIRVRLVWNLEKFRVHIFLIFFND